MLLIFGLGPPEISKLRTLVAQIYLSSNNKLMRFSASGHFGPLNFWALQFLGHHINLGSAQHCHVFEYSFNIYGPLSAVSKSSD